MTSLPPSPNPAAQQKTLRVLLLGPLRLALKKEDCVVAFPADGSQEAFWHSLLEQFPELRAHRIAVRLARNNQFLQPGERLEPGDEIALIPPVSGG
jgi:molybdopterin converting factor small subunit